jgi:hypothetical protein
VIVIDSPGGKLEARYARFETGAILEQHGVLVAFHTDDWITDSRVFRRSAALAVRAGMSRAGALKALTLAGAQMLGLDKRIGSLAAGKDADFAILENDPLSVYCKTLETWVDGVKAFDRNDPQDYHNRYSPRLLLLHPAGCLRRRVGPGGGARQNDSHHVRRPDRRRDRRHSRRQNLGHRPGRPDRRAWRFQNPRSQRRNSRAD